MILVMMNCKVSGVSIGKCSTLIDFVTVLYTRWRFDNYTQDQEPNFTYQNFFGKNCETLFTSKLHSAELLSF